MRQLDGMTAAVTGGARGIGYAAARALAERGVRVAVGDADGPAAERAAAEIGAGAVGLELDVACRSSVTAFVEAAEARHGPLDVLVTNAGVLHAGAFLEEADVATARMLAVNVDGVVNAVKVVLPRMRSRGRGHLITVSAGSGRLGYPGAATYGASKAFALALSEGLRGELRGTGVDVSCLVPGLVDTEMTAGLRAVPGLRPVGAERVGRAVVSVVRRPRPEVYVPRRIGWMLRASALLPRRSRDALIHALRWDRVVLEHDPAERAAYERRLARSSPSPTSRKPRLNSDSSAPGDT